MNRRGNRGPKLGEKAKEVLENIDESNVVMKMFRDFSVSLDDKHDRYERVVKLSRDITIECKRIIFLLHNRDTDVETQREKIFTDAKSRLDQIVTVKFKAVAMELEGHNSYQYLKAYTGGLQEFIEALIFYQYLKQDSIDCWQVIDDSFKYTIETADETSGEVQIKELKLLFPQVEFILGMADFTGELMRKCINSLGAGNIDDCFKTCEFVKYIYAAFLGTKIYGIKEMNRKLHVLRQSLSKMEMVCYNIKVRGSEVPKHMLAMVATSGNMDDIDVDEGFF